MQEIKIGIDYSILAICVRDIDNPFADWLTEHDAQGFAWMPQSVTFAMLGSGEATIRLSSARQVAAPEGAIRAIVVPFHVPAAGLELASVAEAFDLDIPAGDYGLLFAAMGNDLYDLTFIPGVHAPAILVADNELKPPAELCMRATPA